LTKPHPRHLPFAALAAVFGALATAYQQTIPLFEAPDEPSHMQYVGFLGIENRLPLYGASPEVPGEGMQPPPSTTRCRRNSSVSSSTIQGI
jgi:hypothetical protein